MKKILLVLLASALVFCLVACQPAETDTAGADASKAPAADAGEQPSGDLPTVGISTGSSGTSWRDIMIDALKTVGNEYKTDGVITDYKLVNNVTNGDATEQAGIIRDFINEGVDIIMVNPNSPDALNGAIKEAQDAGILVVAFDATVTAPDVINVTLDHYAWNKKNVEFIAETLGSGDTIQIYGLDGHPANNDRIAATDDVLAGYPDINLAQSTTGGWDQTLAKEATAQILASGQNVDAIITQDGMAYGCLSACIDAGKLPKVMFGDPGTAFFKEWKKLRNEGADFLACAQPNPPGIGGTAFRIALQLYQGKTFNEGVLDGNTYFYKVSTFVTNDNFDEYYDLLKDQPDDYLLSEIMPQADVEALFSGAAATAEAPEAEEPTADPPMVGISTGSSGTSWRDIMIDALKTVGEEYKADGVIVDYKLVNNVTNGDATEQAGIIRDFINEGVDIIMVNPNSPDALNGAIEEAQDAGILVVAFDATVTAPDVINITLDHYAWNKKNVEFIAETLGSGDMIQVYGLDGHPANNDRITATDDVLAGYPDIKLVQSTTGGWDQTLAKEAAAQILASGQNVDGIITQDGMAYGCLSACLDAGKLPKVMFGDPGTAFFKEWKKLRDEGVDFLACAQPNPPGIGGTAFRIALQLYQGKLFNEGVLDGNTYFYKVSTFVTDENFDEFYEILKDQPDDYLLSEIMPQDDVEALFN